MLDWSKYYLRDIPFVEFPNIRPDSKDDRINGKIFSSSGMEAPYKKLLDFIEREKGICYVRSDSDVLGTGKSALMAAIYWHCKNDQKTNKTILPAWVNVQDFRSITQLMGKVVDTLVFEQVTDRIIAQMKETSVRAIDRSLRGEKLQRSPSANLALSKILSTPKEELPWKYVNIRRSIPTVSAIELFEYLMVLFRTVDKRRVLICIDQFEEYVRYQRGAAGLERLGNDVNDIMRMIQECGNLTFILTLHPVTQREFEKSAGRLIDSFGRIVDNAATVNPLKPNHLVEMAKTYIGHFRTQAAPARIGPLFPFEDDALEYVAKKSRGFPRDFIRYLHNAMIEARLADEGKIDLGFIRRPVNLSRIGISD